ncbi:MAG: hypothetical protein HQ546_10285 [Planctomycetes bacterium]|nr:hypothetical protein [Planctomycetota bacterium]
MAKIYYTETEASAKLNVKLEQLLLMVRQGKLHAYADGTKKMFKVAEVDKLIDGESQQSDIQLTPADLSGTHDSISLADSETSASTSGSAKGDTVITSEGISIFAEEDLEIEPTDPMAKTQIAPSLDDQINLEGANTGSGLLDLTQESDDTSLGAEVLDRIDMESGESPSPSAESVAESIGAELESAPAMEMPVVTGPVDPGAGAFAGIAAAGAILMLLLSAVGMAVLTGKNPAYLETVGQNLLIVVGGAVTLVVVAAVAGLLIGKRALGGQADSQG